jgi:hypothetical protein
VGLPFVAGRRAVAWRLARGAPTVVGATTLLWQARRPPAMLAAQVQSRWWVIPLEVNGAVANPRIAVEHAERTGRRYSTHASLLEALGELPRLRR